MGKQTGSISFEATGGFNSYAKQNYATLSQIKGQFATSTTSANDAAKVATIIPSNTGWELYSGATVTVKFSNANSATGTLTLNVNGSGAKEIRDYNGNNLEQAARAWSAGAAMALTYDGTYWRIQDSNLIERMHSAETEINQTATSITSLASMQDTYTKPDGTSGTNSMKTYVDQTAEGINTTISGMQTDISNKANGSTVTALSNKVNTISDTVDGHTQTISSVQSMLETKADSSTVSTLTTRVSNVEQDVSGFKTTVSETYATKTELSTETSNRQTAIQQSADAINLNVSQSYAKTQSRGEQLVTNGSGIMGDNTNFSALTFDSSKANCSAGSFTIPNSSAYVMPKTDEFFPIDPTKKYRLSVDAISANGVTKLYSFPNFYDSDKLEITASNHMYLSDVMTLTQPLSDGDTVVYLDDVSSIKSSSLASRDYGFIFWDYTNRSGYTWPEKTYSRNVTNQVFDYSGVDFENNTVTLLAAWSGGAKPAGTKLSQATSGSTFKYVGWRGAQVPMQWTTKSGLIGETDYSGTNKQGEFPPGVAYCKIGFLWNYNKATDQTWVTNISFAIANASEETVSALESRITTAESSITQQAGQIALKANVADVNTKQETAALLEVKANKATLTSEINASADTVKIDAARVNIEGAAIFTSGRLSQTSLDGAYDAIGSASAAQAAAISAAAANAVKRTQRIYFRAKNTISTWSMPTAWVTNPNDTWNDSMSASGWSTKVTPMSKNKTSNTEANKYLYLYTCEQREMADGTILYTPVLLDDSTTIIDGGNIITGTVTANQLNATNINASKILTIGAFQENTQDDILNSNIQVGGRNLLGNTAYLVEEEEYTGKATSAWAGLLPADYILLLEETTALDEEYTLSFDARVSGATIRVQWRFNYISTSGTYKSFSGIYATPVDSTDWHRYYITLPTPSTRPDDYVRSAIIVQSQSGSTTDYVEVRRFKLERGNKPTDWTPAPEDTQASIDSLSDYTNLIRNWYANCATAAGTAAKIATINPETTDFTTSILTPGTVVFVKFATTNSAAVDGLTLNINNTGAKPIRQVRNGTVQNLPGVGYLAADATYQFTYDGANWLYTGNYDSNSNDNARYVQFYNTIVAGEALAAASIIGGRTDGKFYQIKENSSFDLSHPLLWTTAAIAKDATNYANIYTQCYDRTLATFYTSFTNTTANCIVYLVGTVNGNTFTTYGSNSSQYLTINPPTTEDGRFYIPIGRLGNQSNGKNYFNYQVGMPVTLYAFVDGKFRQVTPTEIVMSHRIYYRTTVANSNLAAPSAWVDEATTNVYDAWTTKVPPLAGGTDSSVTGYTKYPYLYTCEQRKRLDGTIECTKVLLDENTTVIDGGNIITGSVTTNSLTAYNAEIGKISADALEITGSAVFTAINEDTSETTIDGGKIQAQSITVDHITADDLTGEHGAINLHEGTFNFTDPETGKGIIWDGEDLYVRGDIALSYQDIEDAPTNISDFEDANTYVTTDSLNGQLGEITEGIDTISENLNGLSTQVGSQNDALNTLNSDMSTATKNISALQSASDEYAEQFKAIDSFTTIRPGEVEMGLAGSPVRMFLTATGLKFQTTAQQQQPIAYLGVDNNTGVGKLYVTNAVVVQDMELGEWAWTARKNKHLTLKYIGSGEEPESEG